MNVSNGRTCFSVTQWLETAWPIESIFCTLNDVRKTRDRTKFVTIIPGVSPTQQGEVAAFVSVFFPSTSSCRPQVELVGQLWLAMAQQTRFCLNKCFLRVIRIKNFIWDLCSHEIPKFLIGIAETRKTHEHLRAHLHEGTTGKHQV